MCGRNLACREALRAYSTTIDEDLRLLGDEAEVAADSVEHKAILVRTAEPCPNYVSSTQWLLWVQSDPHLWLINVDSILTDSTSHPVCLCL